MEELPSKIQLLLLKLNKEKFIENLLQKSNIYLVGGFIRDSFLDKDPKDIDIVVEGISINNLKKILEIFGVCNIVGISFSVIKFKPFGWLEDIDIALPRFDKKIGTAHTEFEIISNDKITIKEDLKRRDLTINSFCVNIKTNEIVDPFNGLDDLHNKILKATNIDAFIDDPLRIMRTIVFASRLTFKIENNTLKLIKSNAHLIHEIAHERIFDELQKIINKDGDTELAFKLLNDSDLSQEIFGQKLVGFEGLGKLDPLSFYYVLGIAGGKDPGDFYNNFLKGDTKTYLALKRLDELLVIESMHSAPPSSLKLRMAVFNAIQKSPSIEFAVILPVAVESIIGMMNNGIIPKSVQDIQISGNDIKELYNVSGSDIGNAINFIRERALLGRFDWTSREATLEFMKEEMI